MDFLVEAASCGIAGSLVTGLCSLFCHDVGILPAKLKGILGRTRSAIRRASHSCLVAGNGTTSLTHTIANYMGVGRGVSLSVVVRLVTMVFKLLITSALSLCTNMRIVNSLRMLVCTLF